jgi:hypothetical protein
VAKGIDMVMGRDINDTHTRIVHALRQPTPGPEKRSRSPESDYTPDPTVSKPIVTKIECGLSWSYECEEEDIESGRSTLIAAQQVVIFVRNEVIFQYDRAMTLLARGRFREASSVVQVLERTRGQAFARNVNPEFNNKVMTILIDSVARMGSALFMLNTCRDSETCQQRCRSEEAKRLLGSVSGKTVFTASYMN